MNFISPFVPLFVDKIRSVWCRTPGKYMYININGEFERALERSPVESVDDLKWTEVKRLQRLDDSTLQEDRSDQSNVLDTM